MPDLSFDIKEYTYAFGYGKLSAGMLDVAMGTKLFGVLGQHPSISGTVKNGVYNNGATDNWNYSNTTGDHHMSITFLPVTDETGTAHESRGFIDYSSNFNFTQDLSSYDPVKSSSLNDLGYPAEAVRNAATVVAALAIWISYN